jgi:hypothetical protein
MAGIPCLQLRLIDQGDDDDDETSTPSGRRFETSATLSCFDLSPICLSVSIHFGLFAGACMLEWAVRGRGGVSGLYVRGVEWLVRRNLTMRRETSTIRPLARQCTSLSYPPTSQPASQPSAGCMQPSTSNALVHAQPFTHPTQKCLAKKRIGRTLRALPE